MEKAFAQQPGVTTEAGMGALEVLCGGAEQCSGRQIPQFLIESEVERVRRIALPHGSRHQGLIQFHQRLAQRVAQVLVDHQVGEEVGQRVVRDRDERLLHQPHSSLDSERAGIAHMVADLMGEQGLDAIGEILLEYPLVIQMHLTGAEVNLCDARHASKGRGIAHQQEARPARLRRRPEALNERIKFDGSHGAHWHRITHSRCESTALTSTTPLSQTRWEWTRFRDGNGTAWPLMVARPG